MIFLETIKSLTKEQPIALLLGDIDHAISIIYNPIDKKKWTLIDINKGIIHLNTEADLSKAIFESFHEKESDTKELVAFSTEIFHIKTPEQSTSLEASIDELNSTNEQWIAIHQITDTKKDNPDWLSIAIQVKDNNTVKKLLAEGANPNARNKDNEPHLLAAIQNECDELAMLLINHKDINVNQPYGKDTILNSAVRRGNINIVKALLVKGAEVNPMTSDKLDIYSPLNTAVTFISNTKNPSKAETYIEIIILLLRANANPNRAQIKTIIKQENLMNQIIRQPDAQILLEKLQTADPATSPIMIALRRVHLAITAAPKEPTPPTPLAGIKRKNPCCTVATAITDHIIKKSRSEEEPAAEPTIG